MISQDHGIEILLRGTFFSFLGGVHSTMLGALPILHYGPHYSRPTALTIADPIDCIDI